MAKPTSCGMTVEQHSVGLFARLVQLFGLSVLVTGVDCRELYLAFYAIAEVIRRLGGHDAEISEDEFNTIQDVASTIEQGARLAQTRLQAKRRETHGDYSQDTDLASLPDSLFKKV